MGTVYKETYTKPLPPGAELFARKGQRFGRWVDRRGRKRTAKVTTSGTGDDRLLLEASTYMAKYRDGSDVLRKAATCCRDRGAAKAMLVELENRSDKVRAGIRTAAEDSVLDHQTTPLAHHVATYLNHLRAKRGKGAKLKVSPRHVANVKHNLKEIVGDCRFKHLRDVSRSAVERWIRRQLEAENPLSARTINARLVALTAFGNWCVETKRLVANPLVRPPKLDEKAECRRQRRALSGIELCRLLYVARHRPLAEHGRETIRGDGNSPPAGKRSRRTWKKALLTLDTIAAADDRARRVLSGRPDFVAKLERTGCERALIYKTLVLTGLRKGELASLTIGQLELDGPIAYAVLEAADEKAGKGADVPLRGDLAENLRGLAR